MEDLGVLQVVPAPESPSEATSGGDSMGLISMPGQFQSGPVGGFTYPGTTVSPGFLSPGGIDLTPIVNAGVQRLAGAIAGPSTASTRAPVQSFQQNGGGQLPNAGTLQVDVVGNACVPMPMACGCKYPSRSPRTIVRASDGRCPDPCYPVPTWSRSTGQARCSRPRRRPRMNPLNPRAAGRAARRLEAMGRAVSRTKKAVAKANRSLNPGRR